MGKSWHLFSGIRRRRCVINCLRRLEDNNDYTMVYDNGIFQFEQEKGNKKVVYEISINTFCDICSGLYNRSEINNRINDFILQQLYLKGLESE